MTLAELLEAFTLPFVLRAVAVLAVLAVCAGVLSVFVHFRGLEFLSDGLVHAVFPGLVIGYLLGGVAALVPAALIAALLTVALLTLLTQRGLLGNDAAVTVLLTSAFSLGVVLVSKQHDYMSQLHGLLFGHLLTVTDEQLWAVVWTALPALLLVLLSWRRQLFRTHDELGFRAAGFSVLKTDMLLGAALALIVVAGASALGNLLVIAFLIVPAAFATLLSGRLWIITALSILSIFGAGVLGVAAAIWAAFTHGVNISAGGAVVLVLVSGYGAALLFSLLRSHIIKKRDLPNALTIHQISLRDQTTSSPREQ